MKAIERVRKALINQNVKAVISPKGDTIFKVQINPDSDFTIDFGYSDDSNTWFHNRNTNKRELTSVWNVSRDANDKGIGWYSFTTEEILETIKQLQSK